MVGFHELQPLYSLVKNNPAGWRWADRVSRVLNATGDHYTLVADKQPVGILLIFFLKKQHKEHFEGVYYACADAGLMKTRGNKVPWPRMLCCVATRDHASRATYLRMMETWREEAGNFIR